MDQHAVKIMKRDINTTFSYTGGDFHKCIKWKPFRDKIKAAGVTLLEKATIAALSWKALPEVRSQVKRGGHIKDVWKSMWQNEMNTEWADTACRGGWERRWRLSAIQSHDTNTGRSKLAQNIAGPSVSFRMLKPRVDLAQCKCCLVSVLFHLGDDLLIYYNIPLGTDYRTWS